jgi:hypothetical protein
MSNSELQASKEGTIRLPFAFPKTICRLAIDLELKNFLPEIYSNHSLLITNPLLGSEHGANLLSVCTTRHD